MNTPRHDSTETIYNCTCCEPAPMEQAQVNLLISDLEMLREAGWYLSGAGIRPGSEIGRELKQFIDRVLKQAGEELARAGN